MSGQVSVWVPLVVALLGVVGIVAGQLVNAWREDRRWKREQQREELRWQRSKTTENAKLRLEHAEQWREMKIRIYGDLLRLLQDVSSTFMTLDGLRSSIEGDPRDDELFHEQAERAWEMYQELARVANEVEIVASEGVVKALRSVSSNKALVREHVLFGSPAISTWVKELNAARVHIVPLIRSELGVTATQVTDNKAVEPYGGDAQ